MVFASLEEAYNPIVPRQKPIYPNYSDDSEGTTQAAAESQNEYVPLDPLKSDFAGVLEKNEIEYSYPSVDSAFTETEVKLPKTKSSSIETFNPLSGYSDIPEDTFYNFTDAEAKQLSERIKQNMKCQFAMNHFKVCKECREKLRNDLFPKGMEPFNSQKETRAITESKPMEFKFSFGDFKTDSVITFIAAGIIFVFLFDILLKLRAFLQK